MAEEPKIVPVGDSAVLAQFENVVSERVSARVTALAARLAAERRPGVGEAVPAFASLLVRFDPFVTDWRSVADLLRTLAGAPGAAAAAEARTVEIPVCYGGTYGPDLPFVAEHAGLTEDEVVRAHSGRTYRIYMLGFLPGFPYLGGLDERLRAPRLPSPRASIPAGSVGIGGGQTGVYPVASPGGWRLIGRTPLALFRPERGAALPYAAGDLIRFVPIGADEFARLAKTGG